MFNLTFKQTGLKDGSIYYIRDESPRIYARSQYSVVWQAPIWRFTPDETGVDFKYGWTPASDDHVCPYLGPFTASPYALSMPEVTFTRKFFIFYLPADFFPFDSSQSPLINGD